MLSQYTVEDGEYHVKYGLMTLTGKIQLRAASR